MTKQNIPTWGDHAASDPRSVAAQLRGKGDGRGERYTRTQEWLTQHGGRRNAQAVNHAYKRAESVHAAISELKHSGWSGWLKFMVVKVVLWAGFVSVYDA